MTGDAVREVFEAMLPPTAITRLCQEFGVVQRQRQRHLGRLVRARVMSAGPPGGADPADLLRASLEGAVPHVARSAFERWFAEPLERLMAAWAERALAAARARQVELSGPRCGVTDWYMVAATTVIVREALREECPGSGDEAALKGHKVLAGGCGAPGRCQCRPARAHARRELPSDASWRGSGRLAARADASLARRRAGEAHRVRVVIRLKDHRVKIPPGAVVRRSWINDQDGSASPLLMTNTGTPASRGRLQ